LLRPSPPFPYTTLFRSPLLDADEDLVGVVQGRARESHHLAVVAARERAAAVPVEERDAGGRLRVLQRRRVVGHAGLVVGREVERDRKSTRLNSSHVSIS